ncbi:antibiotic biosynthesis monooxygenase [uncultured Ferrimonas sp.]|uniref:putative quinol monooxygenase n=1 Tax=uncultured Ferrimonas sp. TaxID=432640 RepID=UPI002628C8F5|nr:antibiotic biosynthesis monooxygenase [uncultured Ferrimonas sp.]
MPHQITLTAELQLSPQIELAAGLAAINQFCADMRREPGCSFAYAMQDGQDERRLILWERYVDRHAQQAHFDAAHTQAFIAAGIATLVSVTEGRLLGADFVDARNGGPQ